MKRRLGWLAAGLVVGLAADMLHPALAQTDLPKDPPEIVSADASAFLIPRGQLSSQESDPYMFLGHVVGSTTERWDQRRWRQYEDAITGYPTALSCLTEDQQSAARPDLLRFDWQGMDSLQIIDVCLFRVFSSLREPNLIEEWLRYFGFKVYPFTDPHPTLDQTIRGLPAFQLNAYWEKDRFYQTTSFYNYSPEWLDNLIPTAQAFIVNVGISDKDHVMSATLSPIIE